jgi:hypothetical protein
MLCLRGDSPGRIEAREVRAKGIDARPGVYEGRGQSAPSKRLGGRKAGRVVGR